jgi:molybdopterin converting factor small subunit
MSQVRVVLPATITAPQPPYEAILEGADVREVLRAVAAQMPQFAQRLFINERLHVAVLVNDRHIPPAEALATRLADGDRVEVMVPVAGG